MDEFNPYAAPAARIDDFATGFDPTDGVWREGGTLVLAKSAELPPRCLKCNAPTDRRLRRNLVWHPSGYYLLILLNWIIYLIVYLAVRQTAKVEFPVCPAHLSRRRRAIGLGWLVSLLGVGVIVVCVSLAEVPDVVGVGGLVAGSVVVMTGIVVGVQGAQVARVRKIDKVFVYLDRVDPAYLKSLPDAPPAVSILSRR